MSSKHLIFILLSGLASACSPTGTGNVELANLVGLWNSSEDNAGKTDVIYTRISSDGTIIEYDFDGDEVDNGLACYQIESGAIKHLENNRFVVSADMHTTKQFEVELEFLDAGHALKIYFLDTTDKTKTLKSQIWTREADASMLDNEPSCKPDSASE